MQISDYCIFGLYMAASLFLGLMAGGRQTNLKTYLLAGHQMHWAMVSISILAALFSGVSFLGAPAETFNHNLIYLWGILAFFVATPITTLVFLPFFYRLNFYTAYEYLEHRFDLRLRRISSAAFIFRVTLWLGLALFVPSMVISEMTHIPLWMSVVFTGGITIIYTVVGGMKAVIYTDVMQFAVLLVGIFVVLIVALRSTPGGIVGAWEIAGAGGRTQFFNWNLSPVERMTVWGAFVGGIFVNLVALVTDQVSVQRYLTATSLRESQKALWFKLLLSLPLMGVFYYTGIVLYAFYQSHPDMAATIASPDRVLPHFIKGQLGAPLPGLLVAAIVAATMSTVSAGINSLTTATLMDFLYAKNHSAGNVATEISRVRIARYWTLGYGVITTILALGVSKLGTLVEASNKISGLFGGPLLGVFFLGVFSKNANASGTLIASICGFCSVLVVAFLTPLSFMWYAMLGCIVTYGVGELASRAFARPAESQRKFSLYPTSGSDL